MKPLFRCIIINRKHPKTMFCSGALRKCCQVAAVRILIQGFPGACALKAHELIHQQIGAAGFCMCFLLADHGTSVIVDLRCAGLVATLPLKGRSCLGIGFEPVQHSCHSATEELHTNHQRISNKQRSDRCDGFDLTLKYTPKHTFMSGNFWNPKKTSGKKCRMMRLELR